MPKKKKNKKTPPPPSSSSPAKKKAKKSNGEEDDETLCRALWKHFDNYALSVQNENGGDGDTDELEAIRKKIQQSQRLPAKTPTSLKPMFDSVHHCIDLLPLLYSVVCHLLADVAMGQYLNCGNSAKDSPKKDDLCRQIQELLNDGIRYFPWQAATWSMAVNFARSVLTPVPHATVARWYEHAVHCATHVQPLALQLLTRLEEEEAANDAAKAKKSSQKDDDDEDEDAVDVKEWIETLLMNYVLGVDWMHTGGGGLQLVEGEDGNVVVAAVDGDDSEEDDEASGGDGGMWTRSTIEATTRFMAAMQWSVAGRHDQALTHLKEFVVTHRLHPNVWECRDKSANAATGEAVTLFRGSQPTGGVLPQPLYQRLCQVFCPRASYWEESSYNNRGYYSFFMDRRNDGKDQKKKKTTKKKKTEAADTNLLYEVIEEHLLPLVQRQLPIIVPSIEAKQQQEKSAESDDDDENKKKEEEESTSTTIVGYEWWVHHRPVGANLGHNLHFDTDEALLQADGTITHPLVSSVLYLTGQQEGQAGPTIVLDQTPHADQVAERAWVNTAAANNSFLTFPGHLLHGVLPCRGAAADTAANDKTAASGKDDAELQIDDLFASQNNNNGEKEKKKTTKGNDDDEYRLTLMVGFWTRRVPDKMKEQKLYGPCSALPPATDEHSWVKELLYQRPAEASPPTTSTTATAVPVVSPVWQELPQDDDDDKDDDDQEEKEMLEIPHAIDHRFFVDGPPECFLAALFEDHDNDDEEEEEEEEMEEDDDDNDKEASKKAVSASKKKR